MIFGNHVSEGLVSKMAKELSKLNNDNNQQSVALEEVQT